MTPFYQDSKGVIYCGDCIQIMHQLQANSVDAVVADPPYSSGGLFRSDKNQKPSDKYMQSDNIKQYPEFFGDNRDAHSWSFWSVLWISEAARLLKDGGYFFMFSDWRQLPNAADVLQAGGLVWRGVIVWNKTASARAPHKNYFRHQCEYILWGSRGVLPCSYDKQDKGPFEGCFTHRIIPNEKHYMTAKPIALIEDIIAPLKEGSVVLDPFLGGGSTACACINNGLRYIGIEMSEEYCEITKNRLQGVKIA